jgi:hypothetical protein
MAQHDTTPGMTPTGYSRPLSKVGTMPKDSVTSTAGTLETTTESGCAIWGTPRGHAVASGKASADPYGTSWQKMPPHVHGTVVLGLD